MMIGANNVATMLFFFAQIFLLLDEYQSNRFDSSTLTIITTAHLKGLDF